MKNYTDYYQRNGKELKLVGDAFSLLKESKFMSLYGWVFIKRKEKNFTTNE